MPIIGRRSPQLNRAGPRRPFTLPSVIQFDLKRPNLALLHMGKEGFFQGVASPRPCLEFSLPRLGLELSASDSALPRLYLDLSASTSASASTKLPSAHPWCSVIRRLRTFLLSDATSRTVHVVNTTCSPISMSRTVLFDKLACESSQLLCSVFCTCLNHSYRYVEFTVSYKR